MKCLSIWMATAMAVFRGYSQTSQTTAVQVNSQAPTYLYGGQASKLEGDVKRRGGDNFDACPPNPVPQDRKSTRLNSSHSQISYAVFCLKKKNITCILHYIYLHT